MVRLRLLMCLALFGFSLESEAAPDCPKTVSYVHNNDISSRTLQVLSGIYKDLGCATRFVAMPSKRSLLEFNQGSVDGELMRRPLAEKKYSRAIVRSQNPLFIFEESLWLYPDPVIRDGLPIAYQFGILWHEAYMKKHNGVSFRSDKKITDAYNRGLIGGFLSNNVTVALRCA